MIGVYMLQHEDSGMTYVGSSHDIDRRISQHLSNLNAGTHHCRNLQALWDANRGKGFVWVFDPRDEHLPLVVQEQRRISDFHSAGLLLNTRKVAVRSGGGSAGPKKRKRMISIDAELNRELAVYAASQGRDVSDVICEALREHLRDRVVGEKSMPVAVAG